MKSKLIQVGDVFETKNYGRIKVVNYAGCRDVTVMFDDGTLVLATSYSVRSGKVRNPNKPNVYGIGYCGVGEYSKATHTEIYTAWHNLISKCYRDCTNSGGYTMDLRWHSFQNFAHDYVNMVGYGKKGWQLFNAYKSNIVSVNTYFLVPDKLNRLLNDRKNSNDKGQLGVYEGAEDNTYYARCRISGVVKYLGIYNSQKEAFLAYKEAKETEIRRLALLYEEVLDKKVVIAMMQYKVAERDIHEN